MSYLPIMSRYETSRAHPEDVHPSHVYKSGLSKYPNAQASPARCADLQNIHN